ncbi:bifunctional DNA primase/polymerase [Candidatus Nitrosocosmicus hydrocola]|uniref:bifunctional DNA primase/polymerase n=1 Tax=Candidatus Nitrosocosmicus hydrocola TaxID=1826872 RepID=UPI001373411B|nr:bifunctional DNA primase/polymerase [Candidatus Nitrosocosmicus hydrocola]
MNFSESTDFWYYEIGVNVIPINSKEKITYIKWSEFEYSSVSEEQYIRWKTEETFNQGIAVIAGKIWRGKYKGKNLACIDIDNKKGIEEFLSHFGEVDTIEKLASKTIVEWHKDNPNKVHVYFIVEKPLTKKSGITVHNKDKLMVEDEIPALEVKSEGSHGIMIVSPSIHKNGFPYEIIGAKSPTVLNETQSEALENSLNNIYNKHNDNSKIETLTPITELFKSEFIVTEGNNRHEALLRVMESLIQRLGKIFSEEKIKDLAWDYNQEHFKPPLDRKEFEKQWNNSKNFIAKSNTIKNQETIEEDSNSITEILSTINDRYINIFYDQFNRLYVTLRVNDHVEHVRLDSNRFKSVIRTEYYAKEHKALSDDKLEGILKLIESQLTLDENVEKRELHLRVAKIDDDSIYYDLTNLKWEIVKISKEGWDIIQNNEIPIFKRHDTSSISQVYPLKDYDVGTWDKFLSLFNLGSKNDKVLFSVLLISLFIPDIPKPILILSGEGGGAKTTAFNIIKRVVDPGSTDTIAFPKQINDLVQILDHNYINCFDNVSSISEEISDLICRAVTGAGYSKRALYTDDSDIIYKIKRFIGVNGINLATTRADFLDRSLIIKAKRIEDRFRKKEADIEKEIERLKPHVLGFIFDELVKVLKYRDEHPNEKILENGYPRMADFAEWGEVIARCLGYRKNEFTNAYYENINNQNDEVIESSPIAEAILLFVIDWEIGYQWSGTPSRLHTDLTNMIDQIKPDLKKSSLWPKASSALTPKINEVKTNLRHRGVHIVTGERDKDGKRIITMTKLSTNKKICNESKENGLSKLMNVITEVQEQNDREFFNPDIYRIRNTDNWACKKCSQVGDIHYMKKHTCASKN